MVVIVTNYLTKAHISYPRKKKKHSQLELSHQNSPNTFGPTRIKVHIIVLFSRNSHFSSNGWWIIIENLKHIQLEKEFIFSLANNVQQWKQIIYQQLKPIERSKQTSINRENTTTSQLVKTHSHVISNHFCANSRNQVQIF